MNAAEAFDNLSGELLDLCFFAHIANEGLRLRTEFARQPLSLSQPVWRSARQREPRPSAPKGQGDCPSNAPARASDDRYSPLQRFVNHFILAIRNSRDTMMPEA
jgi:hypothetical protein